jgi:hypothetical protein
VLADEVDCIMAGEPYQNSNLADCIISTVAATLDFTEPWADHYKKHIREIAGKL